MLGHVPERLQPNAACEAVPRWRRSRVFGGCRGYGDLRYLVGGLDALAPRDGAGADVAWNQKMTCSVLVFDFFGVICSEIAPFWLREHFSEDEAGAVKADIVAAADRGEVSQKELFRELSARTGISAAQIETEWHGYVRIDREVVDFITVARSKYRIALLTNSPSQFFWDIMRSSGIVDLFEVVVVSSEEGNAKPDLALYEVLLSRLGVRPEQALMIDDNAMNIAGAERAGMQGLLFTSCEELRLLAKIN